MSDQQPPQRLDIRTLTQQHPYAAASWLVPPFTLAAAAWAPADAQHIIVGWAIYAGLVALVWSATIIGESVVRRVTQVLGMFFQDVAIDDGRGDDEGPSLRSVGPTRGPRPGGGRRIK